MHSRARWNTDKNLTSLQVDHRQLIPNTITITTVTLLNSDQLRLPSKSVYSLRRAYCHILSATMQPEGRQVTTKGNFHRKRAPRLRYNAPTLQCIHIYMYIGICTNCIIPKYLHGVIYANMLLIVLARIFIRWVAFALNGTAAAALNSACLIQHNNNSSSRNKRPQQARYAIKAGDLTHFIPLKGSEQPAWHFVDQWDPGRKFP